MLRKPYATPHVPFAWDGGLRAPLLAHVWLGFRSKSLIPGRKGVPMLRIVYLRLVSPAVCTGRVWRRRGRNLSVGDNDRGYYQPSYSGSAVDRIPRESDKPQLVPKLGIVSPNKIQTAFELIKFVCKDMPPLYPSGSKECTDDPEYPTSVVNIITSQGNPNKLDYALLLFRPEPGTGSSLHLLTFVRSVTPEWENGIDWVTSNITRSFSQRMSASLQIKDVYLDCTPLGCSLQVWTR